MANVYQAKNMTKSTETPRNISQVFSRKKQTILQELSVPDDFYDDLSPKGSIDAEIRDFINEINSYEGLVTTSSCSGRVSVFLEGEKREVNTEISNRVAENDIPEDNAQNPVVRQNYATPGGKGGGGRWLFVSHTPIDEPSADSPDHSITELFNLQPVKGQAIPLLDTATCRLIHFKFEPMILHILASDSKTAQKVLSAASQAGFRESGAFTIPDYSSTNPAPIPIAVRMTGLALDNIIGSCASTPNSATGNNIHESLVPEPYLRNLVVIANEKFRINELRTERFRALLAEAFRSPVAQVDDWEDANTRRERKRAEGLRVKEQLSKHRIHGRDPVEVPVSSVLNIFEG